MFDTHAHVHDAAFDADRADILARARAAGVDRILTVGTDLENSRKAQVAALAFRLEYAVGIHPHEAKDAPKELEPEFDEFFRTGRAPVAIGEFGLDYFYEHSPRPQQAETMRAQLRYARARRLPAIFHQRDAWDDFAAIVRAEGEGIRGVVHCFTGDARQAKIIVEEFGFRLGIGGVVTFRNAEPVRRAVRAIGLEHLILETDCPYLAPTPQRGRRNEPAFMPYVAEQLAQLFETDVDEVAAVTNRNARELFGDGPAS